MEAKDEVDRRAMGGVAKDLTENPSENLNADSTERARIIRDVRMTIAVERLERAGQAGRLYLCPRHGRGE